MSSLFKDDLLKGQVALVTGGGSGIGAQVARELASLGATVIIAARKLERLEKAAASLSAEVGRPVYATTLDIRDRGRVKACVAEILASHGPIDLLVNNGGGQFLAPAETISPNGWDAVIATNLTGTWSLTQEVAKACMLKRGGRIVNITMLTERGFPGMAHSVAARSGVEAMTRTLAVEWAQRGVRINCVAPGLVASSGLRTYPAALGVLDRMPGMVPLKRLARREEIAWLVAYLASPAGDYVTGQTWTVDGGHDLWAEKWPVPDPKGLGPAVPEVDPWED